MSLSKIVLTVVMVMGLTVTVAFAATNGSAGEAKQRESESFSKSRSEFNMKMLSGRRREFGKNIKERKVPLMRKERIYEEKSAEMSAKFEEKRKQMEEFKNLPLEEKKEKLISNFKETIDKKVIEGKITQEKADELISRFIEKIENWDGNGFPGHGFKNRGFKK